MPQYHRWPPALQNYANCLFLMYRKTLAAIVYKSLNFIVTKHNRNVQKQQLLVWLVFLTQSSNFHFPYTKLCFDFALLNWSLVIIIL